MKCIVRDHALNLLSPCGRGLRRGGDEKEITLPLSLPSREGENIFRGIAIFVLR
jgi:hypothetical protein